MPSFTMELWRVIDMKPDSVPEDKWLGLDDYPLLEGDYRETLNTKIKNHFMYQEIGHETVEQFTFSLRRKMHEIMPLYNQLYESERVKYDPLQTMSIETIVNGAEKQLSTGGSESLAESDIGANARNIASNFPQTMLAGDKDYASSGADSNSQTKTVGKSKEDSTASTEGQSENTSKVSGYQGSPASLILQARAAILNVDMLIINELDSLFMSVWNNGDDYSRTKGRFFN